MAPEVKRDGRWKEARLKIFSRRQNFEEKKRGKLGRVESGKFLFSLPNTFSLEGQAAFTSQTHAPPHERGRGLRVSSAYPARGREREQARGVERERVYTSLAHSHSVRERWGPTH